jgi:hypothetical protein
MTSFSRRPPGLLPPLVLLMAPSLLTACATPVELSDEAKASVSITTRSGDLNSGCFVIRLGDAQSKTQDGTFVCPTVDLEE